MADLKHHTYSGLTSSPLEAQYGVHTTHIFSAWTMCLGLDFSFLEKLLSTLDEAGWQTSSGLAGCWLCLVPIAKSLHSSGLEPGCGRKPVRSSWLCWQVRTLGEKTKKGHTMRTPEGVKALPTWEQPRRPSTPFDAVPVLCHGTRLPTEDLKPGGVSVSFHGPQSARCLKGNANETRGSFRPAGWCNAPFSSSHETL